MFETVIIADMKLADLYQHQSAEPLPCPISVYTGSSDPAAAPITASAWQALTAQPLLKRNFDGDHFFLYADPKRTAEALVNDIGWVSKSNPY